MEKQWALVTGASSGIGFAYAKELASRGYPVVMVSNEEQAIQEKGEWIRKTYGVDVLALYQDLAVPGAAKALFDICQEEEIIVDILVNNAGMFFLNEIVDEKEVKVEKMLYLHMTTPTQLCYYFGKEMKRREHGHILIMSSLSCWFPFPGISLYASTKRYLKSMAQGLRTEMKAYGVNVTVVCPGAVATNLYNLKDNLKELALKRRQLNDVLWTSPVSQYDYWRMIFHADSLFDTRLYDEARQVYDLAFSDDRYILPSQLSTTANKMTAIGDTQAALTYLRHRLAMEKDFYEDALTSPYTELRDTFKTRSRQWQYNLELKKTLESIFERDQYYRLLWSQAVKNNPDDAERNERLARQALMTDSLNLVRVGEILSQYGFPRKEQVGDFGNQAVWLVFQHADLDYQKRFLPQLEVAVSHGDIAPVFLALLRDRIDVREGRPQRYGTQIDGKGNLAPLLDASHVNQWRQEVGLPAIEQFGE